MIPEDNLELGLSRLLEVESIPFCSMMLDTRAKQQTFISHEQEGLEEPIW